MPFSGSGDITRTSRFRSAPRDLCDISYLVGVCEGTRQPDPCAYTLISGASSPPLDPDDMASAEACRNIGYTQGFWCQFGGRVEVPTPPQGMPREHLSAFANGILDGAEAARLNPLPGNSHLADRGRSKVSPAWQPIVDPFADIHAHPGLDPADSDYEVDAVGGHDDPPMKAWPSRRGRA